MEDQWLVSSRLLPCSLSAYFSDHPRYSVVYWLVHCRSSSLGFSPGKGHDSCIVYLIKILLSEPASTALSTQLSKWISVNLMLRVTLQCTTCSISGYVNQCWPNTFTWFKLKYASTWLDFNWSWPSTELEKTQVRLAGASKFFSLGQVESKINFKFKHACTWW